MKDEIAALENLWRISPVAAALIIFVWAVIALRKLGLLSWKDSTEDRWRERIEEKVHGLEKDVSILQDRWDRRD